MSLVVYIHSFHLVDMWACLHAVVSVCPKDNQRVYTHTFGLERLQSSLVLCILLLAVLWICLRVWMCVFLWGSVGVEKKTLECLGEHCLWYLFKKRRFSKPLDNQNQYKHRAGRWSVGHVWNHPLHQYSFPVITSVINHSRQSLQHGGVVWSKGYQGQRNV